jgi:hypothetical protein
MVLTDASRRRLTAALPHCRHFHLRLTCATILGDFLLLLCPPPTIQAPKSARHSLQPSTQLSTIDTARNHRHSFQPSTQLATIDTARNHRHSFQPSTQLATIDTACNYRHSIQPSTQSSTLPACHRDLSCSTRRHSYTTSTTSLVSRLPTTHDKHTKLLNP